MAHETNLQETTFILPRDRASEGKYRVKVRIFIPTEEIPFGGHPTLGTAMVLRNRGAPGRVAETAGTTTDQLIALDLKVGKIPVTFHKHGPGHEYEHQDCRRAIYNRRQVLEVTRSAGFKYPAYSDAKTPVVKRAIAATLSAMTHGDMPSVRRICLMLAAAGFAMRN